MGCHVVPGRWLLQGGTTGGGGVLKWLKESMFSDLSFYQMDMLAESVPPGADGLVFLPYMPGERSPIWNPEAKGIFFGLDYTKTRAHIIRAVMEGVAFSLRHNIEVAESAGAKLTALNAMGGSSNSLVWTQIKSDITAKRIIVPLSDTATTLGAAILAGVGAGVWSGFEEAVTQTVKFTREHSPNGDNSAVYHQRYKTYRAIYENLKSIMGD
jgi:xylulokinase